VLRRVVVWEGKGGGAFISNNASYEAENAVINVLLCLLRIFCFLIALGLSGVKNEEWVSESQTNKRNNNGFLVLKKKSACL
jgi:hypothetical protein